MSNNYVQGSILIDPLEHMVNDLYNSFVNGTYEFKEEDLPYMEID